jgi:Gamma-glutamyltranspeptidase
MTPTQSRPKLRDVYCEPDSNSLAGMYHSGIGGGGFVLVRSSNGTFECIDFRETAPAAAFEDMYRDNILASVFGGLARYGLRRETFIGTQWNG